jgi:hypothetical protein
MAKINARLEIWIKNRVLFIRFCPFWLLVQKQLPIIHPQLLADGVKRFSIWGRPLSANRVKPPFGLFVAIFRAAVAVSEIYTLAMLAGSSHFELGLTGEGLSTRLRAQHFPDYGKRVWCVAPPMVGVEWALEGGADDRLILLCCELFPECSNVACVRR